MTTPTTVNVRIQLRADTAANWTAANPILLANELGRETDTGKVKIGDGTTAWTGLAYQRLGGLITDADIAANAEIAVSKLADGAARQLLQTDAAGTGVEWTSNVDVPGTLDVTGAGTFDGSVTVAGNLTVNGQSDLRFADADSSNWVAFQAPAAVAGNVTWTLPDADGTADQVLKTDGAGVLGWVDPSTGGGGTVTSVDVSGGTGLTSTGGPITTSGTITIDLDNTAVSPGSYTYASITVDQQGRLTAASNGTAPLTSSDIGVTVQGYDADTAKLDVVQTFTAVQTLTDPAIVGTILEDVYTISDGAAFEVDPGNGSVQLITLGASRTPKATNFAAGESITLMVDDGTAYTLTWTDTTWGPAGVMWTGGSAPTLATTGYTVIQFWKVGTQVYGAYVGDAA